MAKRFGIVACISGRRASTPGGIVSLGSIAYLGNPRLRDPARGAIEVELDPEVAGWSGRMEAVAARAGNDELQRLRVRPRTRTRSAAQHWRGAPDEAAAEAAVAKLAESG